MGFQPTVQLESPLNRMAKFQQLESGQRANELAKMQMQEYQRGLQEQEGLRNYLAGVADINAPGVDIGALRHGQAGAAFAKQLTERAQAQANLRKTQADTKESQFKHEQERYAHGIQSLGAAKSGADVIASLDEGVQRGYFSQEQADAQKAELARLQTMPELQDWINKKRLGLISAEKQLEMSMPKPAAPPAMVAEYKFAKTPDGGGFVGSFQDFVTARAAASRAPAQPRQEPAPSVTTIVDPTNSNQRITIDARQYQGGGPGSPGVIGISKEETKPTLKSVPTHAQKAIVGAASTINKLDSAIKSIEDNPESTGLKGLLPDIVLNRFYPEGTVGRANVADIGSLVMHERSGAAVTASESPRLKPFIPLTTDDDKTVIKKLKRMRQIQAEDQEALLGTYSPEQGFSEFKPAAVSPKKEIGKLTPEEQTELEQLRARFPKKRL